MSPRSISTRLRLKLAYFLLRRSMFDQAQILFLSVVSREPGIEMLAESYAGLAEAEFHRGHFLNCCYYAKECADAIGDGQARLVSEHEQRLLERMRGYVDASANEHAARRKR